MKTLFIKQIAFTGLSIFFLFSVTSCKPSAIINPCDGADITLTVYSDANYKGVSQSFGVGIYFLQDLTIGNDRISSFKLSSPNCMKVKLCEHSDANNLGICKEYTTDQIFLDELNDKVSFIKVEKN